MDNNQINELIVSLEERARKRKLRLTITAWMLGVLLIAILVLLALV
jgi:hypothetical protein